MKRGDLEAGGNLFRNFSRSSQDIEFSKRQNWPWEPWTFLSTGSCPCSTDSPLPIEGCRRDIDWASAKKTSIATRFEKIQRVTHLVKINNEGKVTGCYSNLSSSHCRCWQSPLFLKFTGHNKYQSPAIWAICKDSLELFTLIMTRGKRGGSRWHRQTRGACARRRWLRRGWGWEDENTMLLAGFSKLGSPVWLPSPIWVAHLTLAGIEVYDPLLGKPWHCL